MIGQREAWQAKSEKVKDRVDLSLLIGGIQDGGDRQFIFLPSPSMLEIPACLN
jgi:hypothetical protein